MTGWKFVKNRTAATGGVWRSEDGLFYKRVGGSSVRKEAEYQLLLSELGYPVPEQVDSGIDENGAYYFVERSVGDASLHDQAVAEAGTEEQASEGVVNAAAAISDRLLQAQAAHPLHLSTTDLQEWLERASFAENVYVENPDLDTARTHELVMDAIERLSSLPGCHGHLDYGMPNAFPGGVVDWQHHAAGPLGYDVYPMLEIAAFKGGNRGYTFTWEQRQSYLASLDKVSVQLIGERLSRNLGEFLLVKCFFFLALMRPVDCNRHDKHVKWQYRRTLFNMGLEQYESSRTIDTGTFPTLAEFTAQLQPSAA